MLVVDSVVCHQCRSLVTVDRARRVSAGHRCLSCCARQARGRGGQGRMRLCLNSDVAPWWVEAVGVVQFDLLLGQSLEYLFPPIPFSVEQESEISFLSFPDANSFGDGDCTHDFVFSYAAAELDTQRVPTVRRTRGCGERSQDSSRQRETVASPAAAAPSVAESRCSSSPQGPRSSFRGLSSHDEVLFGTALFHQRRDPTQTRGAHQKAIVVLTKYPFPGLMHQVVRVVAGVVLGAAPPATPEDVEMVLRTAYSDIQAWPAPLPTREYTDLSLLGERLEKWRAPRYDNATLLTSVSPSGLFSADDHRLLRQKLLDAVEDTVVDLALVSRRLAELLDRDTSMPTLRHILTETYMLDVSRVAEWSREDLLQLCRALYQDGVSLLLSESAAATTQSPPEVRSIPAVSRKGAAAAKHFCSHGSVHSDVMGIQNDHLQRLRQRGFEIMTRSEGQAYTVDPTVEAGFLQEVDLVSALYPHLNKLWKLWELAIIGAPICVLGTELPRVTAACLSLASLIAPMPFIGIIRPYLTVHNREIDTLSPSHMCEGYRTTLIVGATNPFFVRHWTEWPHFLCITTKPHTNKEENIESHKLLSADSAKRDRQQFQLKNRMFSSRHFLVKTEKNLGESLRVSRRQGRQEPYFWDESAVTAEPADPPSSSPTAVLHSWSSSFSPTAVDPNAGIQLVRRLFREQTKQFLAPLEKVVDAYFASNPVFFSEQHHVLPASKDIMTSLGALDLPVALFKQRQDMMEIYRVFLETATYRWWLLARKWEALRKVVLGAGSLEDVVQLNADPLTRHKSLNILQHLLATVVSLPLVDLQLLEKLLQLTSYIPDVRRALIRSEVSSNAASAP